MAVRYRHDFTSQLGRQWRINIIDVSGAYILKTFDAADQGFTLQYGDGASNTIDPILGSRCEVILQVVESDSGLRTLISDIVAAQENVFFIEIQEDTGSGYELYWGGKVLNDLIQEPDTFPSEVKLTATDGLASLKDVPFDDSGTLYTDNVQFNELLALLINKTGIQTNLYGVSASDYSLRTVVNWWHNDMGAVSTAKDPLALSRINHRTWWEEVNNDQEYFAALDSYSVLQNIAQGWFSRVFQSNGKYYFMQVPQHGINPSPQRDYAINGTGTIVGTTTSNADREKTINQSSIARLYLGTKRYFPALKSVESNYLHNGSNNVLENQIDYDYGSAVTFPPSNQVIPNPNTIPTKLKFNGIFQTRFINNIEFNTSVVADLQGSNAVSCILKGRVMVTNGTDTYYLWRNVAGVNQWNTNSASRVDIPLELASVNSDPNGNSAEAFTEIEFETPPLPNGFLNVTGTFTLMDISPDVLYTIGGSLYTALEVGGVNWDVDYVGTIDPVVIQYRLFNVELNVFEGAELPGEETFYIASNSSADDGQPDLETEDIRFGADVGGLPAGVIDVYDGAAWDVNTDEWTFGAPGGSSAFNQLLADEILSLQTVAAPVQEWSVRGVFDFYNTLQLGMGLYAPISATFSAWSDTWDGTYFLVDRDTADVAEDPPIVSFPTRISGGVNSQVVQQGVSIKNTLDVLNGLAVLDGTIEEGATVTSIPVKALDAGYWSAGDTVTVFNPNSGESQQFTVTSDTSASDTSISVSSVTATASFYPGSNIMVTVRDTISGFGDDLQAVTDRGATTTNEIDIPSVQFDTTQTLTPTSGQLGWNADDGTLDLGLNGGGVVHKLGETLFFNVKAAEAISKGNVLYASGAVGNSGKIEASKYIANNTIEENLVLGVAAEDISIGDFGFVYFLGSLRGITTDGSDVGETWVDGTILYASATTAGALTSVQPIAPNQDIPIAFVTSAHHNNGALYIRATQLGYHLGELHDVYVPSPSDGEVLTWSNANQRWEAGAVGGVEELNDLSDVTISGLADGELLQYDSLTGQWLNTSEIFLKEEADQAVVVPEFITAEETIGGGNYNPIRLTPEALFDRGTVDVRPEGNWRQLGVGGTLDLNVYGEAFIKQHRQITWNALIFVNSISSIGSGAVFMFNYSLNSTPSDAIADFDANISRFRLATDVQYGSPLGFLEVRGTTGGVDDGIWSAWVYSFINPGAGKSGTGIAFFRDGYALEVDDFNTSTVLQMYLNYPAKYSEYFDGVVTEFTISPVTTPNTGATIELRNKSIGAPDTFAWSITPSSYTLLNGTTLSDEDIDVSFDNADTGYIIRLNATRAGKTTLQASKIIRTR